MVVLHSNYGLGVSGAGSEQSFGVGGVAPSVIDVYGATGSVTVANKEASMERAR
jgi:hypothetical protein